MVSNVVSNQATVLFGTEDINTVNGNGLSNFGYTWGQFIDHDMDLTPTQSGKITSASWSSANGGTATITVATGIFDIANSPNVADTIVIAGMTPAGYNGTFVVLSSVGTLSGTTVTYALTADPGSATVLGTITDNTSKDGKNGFPIPKDPFHDGLGPTGPSEVVDPIAGLGMDRSLYNPATGVAGPREQINVSTSYLDLSQTYGSTNAVAAALRTGSGGLLKSSPGFDGIPGTKDDLLPFYTAAYFTGAELAAIGMGNDVHLPGTVLFAAGDPRANETTELTSLQTLFMRNHNQLAKQLAQQNPTWTDEQIYQGARRLNIAQYQNVTYTGYLPALLGPNAMPAYTGYNPNTNSSISTEFSTVGFRFGHSTLNNTVPRHANDGSSLGDISLAQSFFNPALLTPGATDFFGHSSTDIGAVLKGDADSTAQAMDVMAVSSIRNLLFGAGGAGEDLIARDIWRADDHGIGTYNQVRVAYGLAPITDTNLTLTDPIDNIIFVSHGFEQITSDLHVARLLSVAFTSGDAAHPASGNGFLANGKFAGDINPFIAGMAENHVPGSDMGPLFTRILVDQFTRLRDGDRFFYLNDSFTGQENKILKDGGTLGKIITTNTGITNLQQDVFRFQSSITGKVYLANTATAQGGPKLSDITVELIDAVTGDVIATTATDSKGSYTFNISSTGTYKVVLVLPSDLDQRDDPTVTITVSGTNLKKVDIGVEQLSTSLNQLLAVPL